MAKNKKYEWESPQERKIKNQYHMYIYIYMLKMILDTIREQSRSKIQRYIYNKASRGGGGGAELEVP